MSPKATGMFTLDQIAANQNLIFIGTGTGLAPYMSMIRTQVEANEPRKFFVLHGRGILGSRLSHRAFLPPALCPNFTYVQPLMAPKARRCLEGHVGFARISGNREWSRRRGASSPRPATPCLSLRQSSHDRRNEGGPRPRGIHSP